MRFLAALMLLTVNLAMPAAALDGDRVGDWFLALDAEPFETARTVVATAGRPLDSPTGENFTLVCKKGAELNGVLTFGRSFVVSSSLDYKLRARSDRSTVFEIGALAFKNNAVVFTPPAAFIRDMARLKRLHVQVIENGVAKLTQSFRIEGSGKIIDALAEACPAHFAQ
jgi:hypothetical protein